jgi:hypothetical protein
MHPNVWTLWRINGDSWGANEIASDDLGSVQLRLLLTFGYVEKT